MEKHISNVGEKKEQASNLNDEQVVNYITNYLKGISKEGPKVIALVGFGPGSGKTTLAQNLAEGLGKTTVLTTEIYLKGTRNWRLENIEHAGKSPLDKYNPEFLNKLVEKIIQLKDGEEMGVPIYNNKDGIGISADPEADPDKIDYPTKVNGRQDFVIVEGDFQFLNSGLIDAMIYLDVDDVRPD